jgi:peptidoglycan/LPS O-acetylase OafA/YrhL
VVEIFFIISGFLITRSAINSSSFYSFFQKRFLRIYPAYFVSLVVTCFVIAPLIMWQKNFSSMELWQSTQQTLTYFFRNLFIETPVNQIPSLDSGSVYINGSYWTLWQEWRLYIFIGLVVLISKLETIKKWFSLKKMVFGITLILNVLYIAGLSNLEVFNTISFIFTDFRFLVLAVYFLTGSSFYLALDRLKWNFWIFILSIIGICIGICFDLAAVFLPICGSYATLYLSQILPFQKISQKYGDWSYGVYIYSSPIQVLLHTLGLTNFGFYVFNLVSLPMILLSGFLSYHLVEKRFLKR